MPNEKFEYSNTGDALLSIIIEKSSGITYTEFLQNNIFKPIGMKKSRVHNTRRSKNEKINNYAYGYMYSDKLKKYSLPDSLSSYQYVIYMDAITGDGTVNTTIADLIKWDKALRENKLVQKATLIKAQSKHKLKNGNESNYGYGVFIRGNDTGENLTYHSGGRPGYFTFILHFIDKQLTVAVLSNNEYPNVMNVADRIALILIVQK